MGINGSFYGTTSNSAIKPKITWEAVANEGGNYSDVTATLTYSRIDSYMTYGHWAGSLTINGNTVSRSGHYIEITKDSNTLAITHTVRVKHNDNGSKTVVISAEGSISGTTLSSTAISATVTLETIPRAATIAASDGDIGSTVMVTVGKKSDSHRYQVTYTFGNQSGYLTEEGVSDRAAYTQAACLAFPLPESFYEEIPKKSTGVCKLKCTTYLKSTQIGTPQEASFTVRANSKRCGPLVTGTVTDSNPQTLALTGDETVLVRGASTALCVMEAQARYSAALAKKKIADTVITGDTLEITGIQQESIRFWVKDSRGYTAQMLAEPTVIPYFTPILRLEASRKDPISGEGQITARGSFYNGSFGAQDNSLRLRWRLNEGDWQELTPTLEGNNFSCGADLSGLDYTRSYNITVKASDALKSITVKGTIQPGIPVFDWGKDDFAFHVPVYVQDVNILEELQQVKQSDMGRLPAPVGASVGQCVRIKALDANGGISATEGMDQPALVPLTQAEYDALVTAGQVDKTILYLIVRDS